jgi:DNA-binding response OmpR family regulator
MKEQALRKKILIVDDDPAVSGMLQKLFKAYQYRTVTAHDGLEALGTVRKERPDLIVLDVMLPGMDGFKVCRMIKYDQKLKQIPIMILTSRMTPEDERLAFQCGADAFVPKSTKTGVILSQMKKLLEM